VKVIGQWSVVSGETPGVRLQVSGVGCRASPVTRHPIFRIPHSAFRTPHSALRTPHSAFRIPHSAFRTPHSALHTRRAGLSLIELLASLALFGVLVGLLAVTLNTAGDTWRQARLRSRLLIQGRAVMEFFVRDLRTLAPLTNAPMELADASLATYGGTNQALLFCRSLPAPSTNGLALEWVRYDLAATNGTFGLLRWCERLPAGGAWTWPDLASPPPPSARPVLLADGVAALRFLPPAADPTNAAWLAAFPSNCIPPYLDVYIELLDPDDARAAGGLADPRDFVERHAIRLSRRVFLPASVGGDIP